ncbi:tyrosine-type recombinase/integrase [Denitromonas iodatirespirans]|uniref:Tyrosine-type recombinase/integrase n=1 Tax=Denitromonas iodatirespirans TaxID=2795389 RepID=A0A944HDI6_DENI1|nr:tyrosine-type recombinase/integrase [Denitromonas iodatirespirans]MBT0962051.1 tyrosine-type recombinase/integrase [Denitromonas iodatirespirans]
MGRRRTKDLNLPPRMHRKGETFYYVTTTQPRKWIKLGKDLNQARIRWAELEGEASSPDDRTFAIIARRYEREIIPAKAIRTQRDNMAELANLLKVFGTMPIDAIRPADVRTYLDLRGRTAKTRANREKALLSHIFNHAREWGYTNAPNPCAGIRGHKETGRDRYVQNNEFTAVREHAHYTVQNAMDLALLTGQRPADLLRLTRGDIREGALHIVQAKTGKKLAIEITGELAQLIECITSRPAKIGSQWLIHDESGQPLTYWMLRNRFDKARTAAGVSFQFRDIRAKSATDMEDLGRAQQLLGHKTRGMTEHYTRQRRGERVKPLR